LARPLRIEFSGAIYHLTSRGNKDSSPSLSFSSHFPLKTARLRVFQIYNSFPISWIRISYCQSPQCNEHEPVHVHGKYQGRESKAEIILEDGNVKGIQVRSVRGRKPLQGATLKNFNKFIEVYADRIVQKWIDYFVFHKQVASENVSRRI